MENGASARIRWTCQTLSLISSHSPLLFSDSGISPKAQFTNHAKWSNPQTHWINQIKGIRRSKFNHFGEEKHQWYTKVELWLCSHDQIRFAVSALSFCVWWLLISVGDGGILRFHAHTMYKTTDSFIHYSLHREHHIVHHMRKEQTKMSEFGHSSRQFCIFFMLHILNNLKLWKK